LLPTLHVDCEQVVVTRESDIVAIGGKRRVLLLRGCLCQALELLCVGIQEVQVPFSGLCVNRIEFPFLFTFLLPHLQIVCVILPACDVGQRLEELRLRTPVNLIEREPFLLLGRRDDGKSCEKGVN
jgi:hypothetical protein